MAINSKLASVPLSIGGKVTTKEKTNAKTMTFEEASSTRFPFGKHNSETLDKVLDEDPQYIAWVAESVGLHRYGEFKVAFEVFTNDKAVQIDLHCSGDEDYMDADYMDHWRDNF